MTQKWGRISALVLLFATCTFVTADDKEMATSEQKAAAQEGPSFKGRLPRYFASIVDKRQRAEIYAIQISYRERIVELQQQLAALENAQQREVEDVLTDEQRQELLRRREAGSKSRSSARLKKPAEEDRSQDEKESQSDAS